MVRCDLDMIDGLLLEMARLRCDWLHMQDQSQTNVNMKTDVQYLARASCGSILTIMLNTVT